MQTFFISGLIVALEGFVAVLPKIRDIFFFNYGNIMISLAFNCGYL